MVSYTKFEPVSLKDHPVLTEKWVQERIAEDPSILGLGDLELKDKERPQPKAGRLDLLLQDPDTLRRYEVEVQLGKTDESHIIRTLEYWDIEKKRYPNYDHCAVIVAEDINSRFLNVISLFNGTIPLIAVQMNAFKSGDGIGLLFTTILDEIQRGLVDDDEEIQEPADRDYWLKKATPKMIAFVDSILGDVQQGAPGYELNYNKHYIGLRKDGRSNNFVWFRPKKKWVHLNIKVKRNTATDEFLSQAGFDSVEYDNRNSGYRVTITEEDYKSNPEALIKLMNEAHDAREQ
ncbi:MAG: hypothetical protein COW30_09055 [Rhodospirillales bacterium CG15_BIG_FIL_POST_REV_8_21_14_020_66_15]|nr:MAG: hypothetical protein COW30_09055 [Rhodospirillales bacterium CG15_BIG_FIL_POST_REV_8_21_14_020_66_15]